MKGQVVRIFGYTIVLLLQSLVATQAHDRTTSYSTWWLGRQQARVTLNLSEVDTALLPLPSLHGPDLDAAIGHYVGQHLTMWVYEKPCVPITVFHRVGAPAGRFVVEWYVACPEEGPISIQSELFSGLIPGHLHFASIRSEVASVERVLTRRDNRWNTGVNSNGTTSPSAKVSITHYLGLGLEHIASGYDHLVFLFALLMSRGSLGSFVRIVTSFTLGHSLTLALATWGMVLPDAASIEALIGLSVALVSLENFYLFSLKGNHFLPVAAVLLLAAQYFCSLVGLGRISATSSLGFVFFSSCYYPLVGRVAGVGSLRWIMAFLFGLVHGFGFASVLHAAGLPPSRLFLALLGFNMGVEVGQIAFIALSWPFIRLALSRWGENVIVLGSTVTMGFGVYWFLGRTYS